MAFAKRIDDAVDRAWALGAQRRGGDRSSLLEGGRIFATLTRRLRDRWTRASIAIARTATHSSDDHGEEFREVGNFALNRLEEERDQPGVSNRRRATGPRRIK
jgi:hypothetical protein